MRGLRARWLTHPAEPAEITMRHFAIAELVEREALRANSNVSLRDRWAAIEADREERFRTGKDRNNFV